MMVFTGTICLQHILQGMSKGIVNLTEVLKEMLTSFINNINASTLILVLYVLCLCVTRTKLMSKAILNSFVQF